MDMTLSDIEAKADELARQLLAAGKSEALLLGIQLEGLRDLAQIKAVGDQRAQWNASVEMRRVEVQAAEMRHEREVAAMERTATNVADALPKSTDSPVVVRATAAPCPSSLSLSKDEYYVCTNPANHEGPHTGGGKVWTGPGNMGRLDATKPDPTKPAVDRLHELVSMWNQFSTDQSDRGMDELRRNTRDGWYAEGQSVAWGKAAAMLQDILTEGGI